MPVSAPQSSAHLRVGQEGEDLACRYLEAQYYDVLHRNVRMGPHEIDVIAYDPIERTLVFVEVKSRARTHQEYVPELNMTWHKRQSIGRAARRWIANRDYDGPYRLDLLCIARGRVLRHYQDIAGE